MKNEQDIIDLKSISRRDLVRKSAKAAYVVPLVLAAVNATERPAFAQFSCNDDAAKGLVPFDPCDG
jgi:hypothetical protein